MRINVSFATEATGLHNVLAWRAHVTSKGRALLLLFLFSDVEPGDAPTRLHAGSHRDIVRKLAPAGAEGLSLRELAMNNSVETAVARGDGYGRGGNGLPVSAIPLHDTLRRTPALRVQHCRQEWTDFTRCFAEVGAGATCAAPVRDRLPLDPE